MKRFINKIKKFNDSKPCIKTDFNATTSVYRAARDKAPAFSFNIGGKLNFGFIQVALIAISLTALALIYAASVSAKYKKKYKSKLEKLKSRYEKKQARLERSDEE